MSYGIVSDRHASVVWTFLLPSGSTFPIEFVIDTGFTSMILEELQDDLRCDRALASLVDFARDDLNWREMFGSKRVSARSIDKSTAVLLAGA